MLLSYMYFDYYSDGSDYLYLNLEGSLSKAFSLRLLNFLDNATLY